MAKSPCTDCIEKYEKTKQRKRKAKQRQKQKAVGSAPSLVAPALTPAVVSPYSGLSSRVSSPTNNLADLLAVLRVSEAMKQQQNKPELDSLERTPPPPPPSSGRRGAEPPPPPARGHVWFSPRATGEGEGGLTFLRPSREESPDELNGLERPDSPIPFPLPPVTEGLTLLSLPVEQENANLFGEQTVIDLMLRPRIDDPIIPISKELIPETTTFVSPEEWGVAPTEFETSYSLVTGEPMTAETLTSSSLAGFRPAEGEGAAGEGAAEEGEEVGLSEVELQREYDKQKKETERFRKIEEQLRRDEEKQRREEEKQRREEEKQRRDEEKQLERERIKAEKEAKKRVERPTSSQLQIPGVKRSDVASTPKLETFFKFAK